MFAPGQVVRLRKELTRTGCHGRHEVVAAGSVGMVRSKAGAHYVVSFGGSVWVVLMNKARPVIEHV